MNKKHVHTLLTQAVALHQKQQPAAAALYHEVLVEAPGHPEALHLLGVIALQGGAPQKAVSLIEQALAANPQAAAYHYNLGEAHRALKNFSRAEKSYQQCLELESDHESAWAQLALVQHRQRHFKAAALSYRRALSLRPDNPRTLNHLGLLLLAQHDFAAAKTLFLQALRYQPNYTEALHNLAVSLTQLGELEKARESYQRLLTLAPGLPGIRNQFLRLLQNTCDFNAYEKELKIIRAQTKSALLENRRPDESPFLNLTISFAQEENLALARLWSSQNLPEPAAPGHEL
ncbi:MAG TPA: tetratricopeptide repeat protein [Proteobacteria bacterium]|nr:tetratricopeptide repeat protein [Pseudomonadota bacterium]